MARRFPRRAVWSWLLYNWLTVLVLLLLVGWLARSAWFAYQRYSSTRDARRELAAQLEETRAYRDKLTAEVEFLETERGLEERLRTSLPVVKEGEGVIVVVGTTSVAAAAIPQTWWAKWRDLINSLLK